MTWRWRWRRHHTERPCSGDGREVARDHLERIQAQESRVDDVVERIERSYQQDYFREAVQAQWERGLGRGTP